MKSATWLLACTAYVFLASAAPTAFAQEELAGEVELALPGPAGGLGTIIVRNLGKTPIRQVVMSVAVRNTADTNVELEYLHGLAPGAADGMRVDITAGTGRVTLVAVDGRRVEAPLIANAERPLRLLARAGVILTGDHAVTVELDIEDTNLRGRLRIHNQSTAAAVRSVELALQGGVFSQLAGGRVADLRDVSQSSVTLFYPQGLLAGERDEAVAMIDKFPRTGDNSFGAIRVRVIFTDGTSADGLLVDAVDQDDARPACHRWRMHRGLVVPAVAVSFQPDGAPTPLAYLTDSGAVLGPRSDGWRYGWRHPFDRLRFDPKGPNLLAKTWAEVTATAQPADQAWELAVPPGFYQVDLVCPSGHRGLLVEGVAVLPAHREQGYFRCVVPVIDGCLTISLLPDSDSVRLHAVRVVQAVDAP